MSSQAAQVLIEGICCRIGPKHGMCLLPMLVLNMQVYKQANADAQVVVLSWVVCRLCLWCSLTVAGTEAQLSATGNALALTAQTVEYFNGSRIDNYAPYFQLAECTCSLPESILSGDNIVLLICSAVAVACDTAP